jgi:hypothetical protein
MLHETRFNPYFEFHGNWQTHFGIFHDCGTRIPFTSETASTSLSGKESGGCC